jgi:hypothetical protein
MPPAPAYPTRWKRVLISAVLLFHFIAIPIGSNLKLADNPPDFLVSIARYVYYTRLWQRWALFSPEPRRFGLRYHAVLTYRDGKQRKWTRPKAPNWDFFGRHLAYNFQKWDLVSNNLDQPMLLWPGLVGYLERAYRDDFNPLEKIEFVRAHVDWPEPAPTGFVGIRRISEANELPWKPNSLFVYWVKQKRWDYREYSSW